MSLAETTPLPNQEWPSYLLDRLMEQKCDSCPSLPLRGMCYWGTGNYWFEMEGADASQSGSGRVKMPGVGALCATVPTGYGISLPDFIPSIVDLVGMGWIVVYGWPTILVVVLLHVSFVPL